jgi:hypothetical protein
VRQTMIKATRPLARKGSPPHFRDLGGVPSPNIMIDDGVG